MHIGVPKEIKTQEFRVGLTPAAVAQALGQEYVPAERALEGSEGGGLRSEV